MALPGAADHIGSLSVLIVEDDPSIADGLAAQLANHGYVTRIARHGAAALDMAANQPPDAVLLDLGLPDLDGVHVCRVLRRTQPAVPIVILTARDEDVDVVLGLDAGADDYVTKPFNSHVLLARLRAHLRGASSATPSVLVIDDLRLDLDARRVHVGDAEVTLRPKEMQLLVRLASSAGRVVSREQLLDDVWDVTWDSASKSLDVHIHALRRKLGDRSDGRPRIVTVRSFGYRFEA